MNWRPRSSTISGAARGASATETEYMELVDDAGSVIASFSQDTSGNVTTSTGVLTSYLATTVTYNANAVLANTPLSVTVAAGGIYAIELVVHSTSAVVALLMDFGGTATIANFIGEWFAYAITGDESGIFTRAKVTAIGTDFNASNDAADSFITFTGSVEITDAGTFLLRGAQNVSDASDTTILRGSTLTLTKLN